MVKARAGTLLATAVAPALWGTTYAVTRELLPPGRPLLAAAIRSLPVGLALIAITRSLPRGLWWRRAAILGLLNIGLFFALLFTAAYRLPGGVAATVGGLQPLVVVALSWPLLGERPYAHRVSAAAMGALGVWLLVARAAGVLDPVGVWAAIGGTASMATGVVLTRRWQPPVSLLAFTGWQLAAGGLLLLPVAVAFEGVPAVIEPKAALGYAYLAVAGGGLAYALWFRGIAQIPPAAVSLLGLLSPVVALLIGRGLLHETLTGTQVLGVSLVLGAVAAGQMRARPAPDTRPVGTAQPSHIVRT
jgi:probable blue pigment (indigoidine) exporter